MCGSLAKLRHSVSTKLMIEIYNALIHSCVRYGILTWGNAADSILSSLQTVINRAIRIITFAPFGRVDVNSLFKDLKVLGVRDTCFMEKSKFIFKLKNDLLPITLANHFESSTTAHSYTLRSSSKRSFFVPRLRSSEKSIQLSSEKLWNKVPESAKLCSSLNTFKREVKSFLLEKLS